MKSVVVVESLSHDRLIVTPWTAAHKASLSFTISQSLLKLTFIDGMISIHTSISNLRCIYWTTGHLPFDVPQALEPELLFILGLCTLCYLGLNDLVSFPQLTHLLCLSSPRHVYLSPGNFFGITVHIF